MSELKVNKVSPATGTAITLGDSGDTFTVPSGATIVNSGTATGFGGGGKLLQVIQTVKTDTATTTSTSMVDLSGLTVNITPSATTSKILVSCTMSMSGTSSGGGAFQFVRDSTAIGIGDADGSRTRATFGTRDLNGNDSQQNVHSQFLDSPSTTSATTYKIQWRTRYTGLYCNRTVSNTNNSDYHLSMAQITVMEIGA